MNRIILIGNGFDLEHGLKTRYVDFIDDFCTKVESDNDMWNTIMNGEKPEKVDINTLIDDENNFNNKFFCAVKKDLAIQNWVDVEKVYYYELVRCMKNAEKTSAEKTHQPLYTIENLNQEFGFFEKKLKEYLSNEVLKREATIKKQPSIEEYFEKILKKEKMQNTENFLAKIFSKGKKSDIEIKYDTTCIVNFNYTDTDKIYAHKIEDGDMVIRLHGELNNPKNPMIFGYGDELAKNYSEIEELDDNRYLEYVKSIKYSLTDNYSDLYFFINSKQDYHIYLWGLSCGNSDRTLLNELFEHPNCKKIKIFYWQKDDMSDNYLDIYKNISRIFTKKNNLRNIVATKPNSKPLVPNKFEIYRMNNFVKLNDNGHEYYISKLLVTQAQYESIMGTNPSTFKGNKDELPVETVSWYEAAEFCNRLSEQFEKTKDEKRYAVKDEKITEDITKKGFRLPTEGEWIFAATSGGVYTNKTDYARNKNTNDLKELGWYYENSGDKELNESDRSLDKLKKNNCRTHPVGQKQPNDLGIYDMSGNVWEWCEDWYDNDKTLRVVRGGSWGGDAEYCRVSFRYGIHPDRRYNFIGFRLACSL